MEKREYKRVKVLYSLMVITMAVGCTVYTHEDIHVEYPASYTTRFQQQRDTLEATSDKEYNFRSISFRNCRTLYRDTTFTGRADMQFSMDRLTRSDYFMAELSYKEAPEIEISGDSVIVKCDKVPCADFRYSTSTYHFEHGVQIDTTSHLKSPLARYHIRVKNIQSVIHDTVTLLLVVPTRLCLNCCHQSFYLFNQIPLITFLGQSLFSDVTALLPGSGSRVILRRESDKRDILTLRLSDIVDKEILPEELPRDITVDIDAVLLEARIRVDDYLETICQIEILGS